MRGLISLIPRLWANWITLLGSVITTVAGLAVLLFLVVDLVAPGRNPYTSAVLLVSLPALFVIGLVLIPIGLRIDRRRERGPIEAAFTAAMQDRVARNRILFVAVITVVNVALLGYAAKESVTYMDSPKFCGTSCHSVMQPEWDAYRRSPHSNVACVECHIGPGATSYVKAKANGVGQMWAMLTGSYHRPVHPPDGEVGSTCQHCHSRRFTGNRFKIHPHYKPDEKNTPAFNAFLLRVGGERNGRYEGIHSHANPNIAIRYEYLDEKRNKIGKVTIFEQNKMVSEYLPAGAPPEALGVRTMDCVDCHNRPTHMFDASPDAAVDRALHAGLLDRNVPNLRRVAAELLARPDVPREGAAAYFRNAGIDDKTAGALAEIYRLNVYPELKLGWGTYRSQLTHEGGDNVGCFRCHDKEHAKKLPDGSTKALSQDCDSCHERLVVGEDPATFEETLQLLLPK